MQIYHGIDLIEIARIAKAKENPRFFLRILTKSEQAEYTTLTSHRQNEYLAGRFAAKEATYKALSQAAGKLNRSLSWHDIEILKANSGAPVLYLHGSARSISERHRIDHHTISLSHDRTHAIASVLLLGSR